MNEQGQAGFTLRSGDACTVCRDSTPMLSIAHAHPGGHVLRGLFVSPTHIVLRLPQVGWLALRLHDHGLLLFGLVLRVSRSSVAGDRLGPRTLASLL